MSRTSMFMSAEGTEETSIATPGEKRVYLKLGRVEYGKYRNLYLYNRFPFMSYKDSTKNC